MDEGGWSAIDDELNAFSQGGTREGALEMLDEAVTLLDDAVRVDLGEAWRCSTRP